MACNDAFDRRDRRMIDYEKQLAHPHTDIVTWRGVGKVTRHQGTCYDVSTLHPYVAE